MFSPTTATAILNRSNQNHSQELSSSVNSTRRTPPRLQPAAAHAHVGTSSQGLPSGSTTESKRGGGLTPTLHPLHPANWPLVQSIGGKNLLGPTPSLPSLTPLNHRAGALLLLLILRRLVVHSIGILLDSNGTWQKGTGRNGMWKSKAPEYTIILS